MEQTITDTKELFTSLDETWNTFFDLVASVDEALINIVPFKDSWTVAQLATHVKKSNNAIIQGLQMDGKACERNPTQREEELKKTFLDFNAHYQSPDFIVPGDKEYKKAAVVEQLENSIEKLKHLRSNTNLVTIINLPIFGEITKLEILYFVLYHTQRHIRQLKNILNIISNKTKSCEN